MPLLGSALVIETSSRYGPDGFGGTEFRATACDDPAAVENARRALAPWLEPLDMDGALELLAELAVLTKRRAGDAADDELTLASYARRLAEYPPDAVVHVIGSWAESNVFWPAWAELQAALDRRMRARRTFARALGMRTP